MSDLMPRGEESVSNSSGNVAAASAVATIAAVPGKINYCSGIDFTSAGATGAATVVATLTGLAGGTRSYIVVAVAGAGLANQPLIVAFNPPLAASGPNTAITFTVGSLGAGNLNAVANIQGFRSLN